jgi:nucleoside phosphorylase
MPARLRPTAPTAADAILVGDPGRALMLAQELLEQPKMSNHARGLWGYHGRTPAGTELTVQATGMGGPSAAIVLTDLAELGVRRAVRVGSCAALDPRLQAGMLLAIAEAYDWAGPGGQAGAPVRPDARLSESLQRQLGDEGRAATVASLDVLHDRGAPASIARGDAADMQTATLLSRGPSLGVSLAVVLVVTETSGGDRLADDGIELASKRAGIAAFRALST